MRRLFRKFGAAMTAGWLCLSAVPSLHAATSTANLTVQITITASCTINAATLNFGTLAGTTVIAGATNASTNISVTCTNGSPYAIGVDNGVNASGSQRRMKSGANFLNYNLYTNAGLTNAWTTAASSSSCSSANSCFLGTGSGSAQSITVFGQMPAVGTAPATGTYSDTVTMTITY
jgi:spore coat protein U-like protein